MQYANDLLRANPSISQEELNQKVLEKRIALTKNPIPGTIQTTTVPMSKGVTKRFINDEQIQMMLPENEPGMFEGLLENPEVWWENFYGGTELAITTNEIARGIMNFPKMLTLEATAGIKQLQGEKMTAEEKAQLGYFLQNSLVTPGNISDNQFTKWRQALQDRLPEYDDSITESIFAASANPIKAAEDGSWAEIGGRIASKSVGSLPYTAMSLNPYTAAISGVSIAGNKYFENLEQNPDEAAWKLMGNAILTGGVEMADAVLTRRFLGRAGVIKGRYGEKAAKQFTEGFAKKLAIGFFGEGATEMAQATTTKLLDAVFFEKTPDKVKTGFGITDVGVDVARKVQQRFSMKDLYQIFDEGIIGAFTGGSITTVANAFTDNKQKKDRMELLLMSQQEKRNIRNEVDGITELMNQRKNETSERAQLLIDNEVNKRLGGIKLIRDRSRIALEQLSNQDLIEYAKNIDIINKVSNMESPSSVFKKQKQDAIEQNNEIYDKTLEEKFSNDENFRKEVQKQTGLQITEVNNQAALEKIIKKETGRVINFEGTAGVFIGEGKIYINKETALKQGNVTVGSHEILHPILNAMVGNTESQTDVVKSFKNIIGSGKNDLVENLLKRRNITLKSNPEKYYTEYLTAFSDLVNGGQISFEQQSYWEKLVNFLDRIFQGQGFSNISFDTGRGVYNFLKEYSKSVKEGKLSEKVLSSIDVERVRSIGLASNEFQNSKEANNVNQLYENGGVNSAFQISEAYRGMASKIASKYRDVPGYTTMQDILVDEILTGNRGVYDLVQTYNPESGVPLAAYINKFLPSRAIEAANNILDTKFTLDITEVKGVTEKVTEEVAEETQRTSLRNTLGLTDAIVTKVKNSVIKTFGTRLPKVTTPQFFKSLQKSYRTELKPTIAKMMGRQEAYKEFLENNFQLIYDIIPQGTFNKRFKDFVQPVTDKTGKQLREKTAEGKGIFKKKKISQKEFVDYFLGDDVGASTKGTRKTALAEALAEEIAFDATMDVIKTPEVVEKINFANSFTENFAMEVARQIDRGIDFQFMKEAMSMEDAIVQSRSILDGNKLENFQDYKAAVDKILELGGIKIQGFGGTIFEYYVQQKGNSLNIPGVTFEGEALMGNTGVDMTMTITNKDGVKIAIPVELKADGSAQMGSGTFKITENDTVSTSKDGKALNEYTPDVQAMIPVYKEMHKVAEEIQNEEIPFGFPQRGYLTETWIGIREAFAGRFRNINEVSTVEKIINHYNKKGVYYMYLGDKGLLYLGSNPNNLNAKPLSANTKVYISPSNSGSSSDTYANITIRGRLNIDPKTQEQSITLEGGADNFGKVFQESSERGNLSQEFNNIIEQKTGVLSDKVYTNVTKVNNAGKRPGNFFVPYSAEDFLGLLYATVPKGKEGNKALGWIKKNLLDPYSVAMENINRERMQMMNDFKGLKKNLNNVPKQLKKTIGNTSYTNETAVRVWIWNQQGMEIPGLPTEDKQMLLDQVNNNTEFINFANQLIQLNKADGYGKPNENWNVGTITTDLLENLNNAKRKKHLEKWQNNINEIFSSENKNKLEAIYGKNYVASLNNILKRMETGRNRNGGGNRQIDNWLDWLNNSVGAIMFLNVRSAVLQTISTVNYMNWHDNNPLKAAEAFANQPQFWSDFSMIFNSDYLQERRGGTKLNVQENEIAEMANKGGVKGAISYLLNKGFVLTRAADSFAIASGGAAMYRNRVNSYINQGMDQKQAEEQAFRDFRELTEEAQQSSRPDRISMEQAGGFGRLFLAFANTPMQYTRLMKKSAQDIINGRGDQRANWSKLMYYGVIQNFIFNGLQKALFALGFDDEEDENQSKRVNTVAEGMLDSVLRGTGVAGNAVVAGKNFAVDLAKRSQKPRPNFEDATWKLFDVSPPIDSKITKIRAALRTVDWQGDEIMDKGISLDNPAAMASAQFISATTNVPLDRVLRLYDNVRAAVAEDTEAWQRVALLLGWSSWELGMKKEEDKKMIIKKDKVQPLSSPSNLGGPTKL